MANMMEEGEMVAGTSLLRRKEAFLMADKE
jgi:hypothetical protein